MIRSTALVCLMAVPTTAQEMTAETCRLGWQAFNDMTGQTAAMTAVEPDVTAQGWCRVDETNAELKANDFGSLEWRGTGVEDAVTNQGAPEALEVRIDGVDLIHGWKLPMPEEYAGPRGSAWLAYESNPQTHDIIVTALDADFGGLGHFKISAKGGGVDLTSLSSMQITSGGARVNELTLQFQTTPVLKQAMIPPMASAMAEFVVTAIPDDSIDEESRDALHRFVASGPDVGGLLRVSARSEQGMGFLQMVGGLMPLQDQGFSPDLLDSSMEILLSGVTISAEWIKIE